MPYKFKKNLKSLFFLINYILILNITPTISIKASENKKTNLIEYANNIPQNNFYILGPSDTLSLKVNDNTSELNQKFTVNGEGIAKLLRIKNIYVAGLTISELTEVLNEKYSDFVKTPEVELEVLNYRPIKVFVKGEVIDPGMHTLSGAFSVPTGLVKNETIEFNDLSETLGNRINTPIAKSDQYIFPTVFDVLRESGGVTNFADLENVLITRKNYISAGGGRISTTVNLSDSINLEDTSQNIRILDGDTIELAKLDSPISKNIKTNLKSNINPRFVEVVIAGRVTAPGSRRIRRNTSLVEAVETSGGTKIVKGPVRFFRYSSDGSLEKRKFRYKKSANKGSYNNPYLRNGDVIIVGKSSLNIASEIMGEIASPLQGFITSYGLYKAITN